AVLAPHCDAVAVGGERHAADRAGAPLDGDYLLSLATLLRSHRLVHAPRGDAFAVGGERRARDSAGVPLEGGRLLPRLRVPHLHLAPGLACLLIKAAAPRGDAFAVGGERHAADSVGMPLEGER